MLRPGWFLVAAVACYFISKWAGGSNTEPLALFSAAALAAVAVIILLANPHG